MDRNLLKPLIAVVAAAAGLGIWQYARASSPPAPSAAPVVQIDGGNMPADHASHHTANAASANLFTGTLPYMGAVMNTPNAGAMMNSAGAGAMMKSGDMSAMMKSGGMSAMMDSADIGATMSAADKQECLESAGKAEKMQAHMARVSKMPGHMQPDTEPAK